MQSRFIRSSWFLLIAGVMILTVGSYLFYLYKYVRIELRIGDNLSLYSFRSGHLSEDYKNELISRIRAKIPQGSYLNRGQITHRLAQLEFVSQIKLQHSWLEGHHWQLYVHEPVAAMIVSIESEKRIYTVSAQGKLLQSFHGSYPVLQSKLEQIRIRNNFLQNPRIILWLNFLYDSKILKESILYSFISELIIDKSETVLVVRKFNSRFLLPREPSEKLLFKLDAIIRYFILKKSFPRELDLQAEHAIFIMPPEK